MLIVTMVEFFCSIPSLKTRTEAPKVTAWNSSQLMNLMRSNCKEGEEVHYIVNHMGELSATAQQLRGPITSVQRLLQCFQKLYLLTSSVPGRPSHILAHGILKVGQKRLFIRRNGVHLVEMSPLCVLDFYVHESCQRQGLGHILFEFMLEQEKMRPCRLGFDKPSDNLLSFMAKHYNLINYSSQTNQFVVYDDYFEDVKNEAQNENSPKASNKMAEISTTGKLNPRGSQAEEQPSFSRPASANGRPNLNVQQLPQPSECLSGRRNIWRLKQDRPEKSRNSEVGQSRKDTYRREHGNEQGKTIRSSNPDSLLFSVIGEEERVRIQSLCSPSLAQKMNVTHATHCLQDPGKPIKPRPVVTRQSGNTLLASKKPPRTEVQSPQERHPVNYRGSRGCC